jgi:hypothetical protein
LNSRIFLILTFISGLIYCGENGHGKLSDQVMVLSNYIASDDFKKNLESGDHILIIDSIFTESLKVCNNDISEALLTAALATLPYRKIPVTIPVIDEEAEGTIIEMPDSLFKKKVSNLPSKIFFDSPDGFFGDKDKLSHFFGNAFLSYNMALFNLSKFLSILVELFEESFKVDGSVSTRDLLVGNLGELYGRELSEYGIRMPSRYIRYYELFYIKFIY